jgi:methylenetetrahydrofolate dehydrogenase (NADP+) / methenyltetrahydrofolate cyclohydrolase
MAQILKGAPVASALSEQLIKRAERLKEAGITPTLAILRIGGRSDDISYETGAAKRCEKIGIRIKYFRLPSEYKRAELMDAIHEINSDDSIHGCLMFRPLPIKKDEADACALLAPAKDVDGMTSGALAKVFTGSGEGYPPCTAQACIELLDYYGIPLQGKRVTVVGRSLVIGKPVSMLLQSRNATVTMCHTKTLDMPAVCRNSEILIAAAGKAGMIDEHYVSPKQVVIDVGINLDANGKLCGDVKFDSVESIVDAITPVPAGVGSVTTAVLAKHVIEAAEKRML